MRVELHSNGWTPFVVDFDIKKATPEDIKKIATLIYTNTIVIFKNQELTVDDELEFLKKFGKSYQFEKEKPECRVTDKDFGLMRVSGNPDQPGFFGEPEELDWHLNNPSMPDRKLVVYLYAVANTLGSRTSFINLSLAYHGLHPIARKEIENAKFRLILPPNWSYINGTKPGIDPKLMLGEGCTLSNETFDLVRTNILGVKGLYWPNKFIHSIEGWDEERSQHMIETINNEVFKEQYVYHHDWAEGDVLFTEQNFGLHKRWAFPGIHKRLLHRCELDTTNVDL